MLASICCFRSDQNELLDAPSKTPRSPCSWLRSTACELPDVRDLCRNLFARIGRNRRRYNNSNDFSYDSLSYALNFEDDSRDDDEFPLRAFTVRLSAAEIKERIPAPKFGESQGAITIAACS